MLNFIMGRDNPLIDENDVNFDSDYYFSLRKEPEWFETNFAKRVIKDIDQADVLFEEALKNRFGNGMSTEQLSSGTKTLLLIKHFPDEIWYASMGDNCYPFLIEIAKEYEGTITLLLENTPDIPEEAFSDIDIAVNGEVVDAEGFFDCMCEYAQHCIDVVNSFPDYADLVDEK